MKKKKYLFIISLVVLVISIVIWYNSDYRKAENIMSLYDSGNYSKIYEEYGVFFHNNNSQKVIEKYYHKVFDSNSPSNAYELLQARYTVSMLHVGQIEEFKENISENAKLANAERYFRIFWTIIVEDSSIMDIDTIKNVDAIFRDIQKNNDNLIMLHYFWNKYFNLTIDSQMETEVLTNSKYLEQRGDYVFTLLLMEKLDVFEKFYIEEYAKIPKQYSGMEEMFWIRSNSLNEKQLDSLNNSLSNLLLKYEELNKEQLSLKIDIIVKLQETIQETQGDGQRQGTVPCLDNSNN